MRLQETGISILCQKLFLTESGSVDIWKFLNMIHFVIPQDLKL